MPAGRVSSASTHEANSRLVVFSDVDGVLGDLPRRMPPKRRTPASRSGATTFPSCSVRAGRGRRLKPSSKSSGSRTRSCAKAAARSSFPRGYFGFDVPGARDLAGYEAVEFGRPYAEVVQTLHRTAERLAIDIVGFSDMSVEEVARDCH